MMEKASDPESSPVETSTGKPIDKTELRLDEAADVYGDASEAEKYGYVERG
jgi:hypothetical protein